MSTNVTPMKEATRSRRSSFNVLIPGMLKPRRSSALHSDLSESNPVSTSTTNRFLGKNSLGAEDALPMTTPISNRESDKYKCLLDVFFFLLQYQHERLLLMFPDEVQSTILHEVISSSFSYMENKAKQLCNEIKDITNKLNLGQSHVSGILSILQWFLKSQRSFDRQSQVKFSFSRTSEMSTRQ